jgi:hypothetical protein
MNLNTLSDFSATVLGEKCNRSCPDIECYRATGNSRSDVRWNDIIDLMLIRGHLPGKAFKRTKADEKLSFLCPLHGEKSINRNDYERSAYGCSKCGSTAQGEQRRAASWNKTLVLIESKGDTLIAHKPLHRSSEKMMLRWGLCGHETSVTPHDYLSSNAGCSTCAGNYLGAGDAEFFALIRSERYTITGDVSVGCTVKIPVRCPEGHETHTTKSDFKSGHRCIVCSGSTPDCLWNKLIIVAAINRETILTVRPKGGLTNVRWAIRCVLGHKFTARAYDYIAGKSTCKTCQGIDPLMGWNKTLAGMTRSGLRFIDPAQKYVPHEKRVGVTCAFGHMYYPTAGSLHNAKYCAECFALSRSAPYIKGRVSSLSARFKKSAFSKEKIEALITPDILAFYKKHQGKKGMAIDHIIPISWVDQDDIEQIRVVLSVANLQLIPGHINNQKSNRLLPADLLLIQQNAELTWLFENAPNRPKTWDKLIQSSASEQST